MMLRKKAAALAAAMTIGALALAGCSSSTDDDPPGDGQTTTGSTGQGTVALTIAKPDGAITTESHNPYLGDSSASKYGYRMVIFEPLALVNPTGERETTPWLAESVEWADDYRSVTVVPRSGVTWSDGTEFTGDDILYTFGQYLDGRLTDTSGLNYEGADVDGDAITLRFGDSKYVKQASVLQNIPIVPEHVWENLDDPDTDPLTGEGQVVGTGPYTLANWSTESVTLEARDDYWGGELAVPELHYVSYGDNAALTTALISGDADWAQAFLPQIETSFLAADEDNRFWAASTAGAATLFMNLQQKPFDDVAFRQALAWVIDRDAYVEIAREGASEAIWNVTGLAELLADEIQPEFADQDYAVDHDHAREILTDAGYTWDGSGALVDPDGTTVTFSLSVPAGWSDWNTEQQLIAEEVKDALGVEVRIDQPDWGGWDAARTEGTFDAIIHWLEDSGNAYGLYTSTMDPRWVVDGQATFNFGRYDNPDVTEALSSYANASSDDERTAALNVIQTAYVDDVPAITLGAHPLLAEYNTRSYVGWPDADDPYAPGDPTQANIVLVLQNLQVRD